MVAAGTPPLDVIGSHLEHWIFEYSRGRVIVKRRAARVLIVTTLITGVIAVLGGVSALLAGDNFPVQVIGLVTTALSATSAVLLAWDGYFRHRDLWSQRSVILNRLEALRLKYELAREDGTADHNALGDELTEILDLALRSWLQIQGKGSPPV
jgi:hypothetical protein